MNHLMLMLGLNEAIDHLAMVHSVSWYGDYVLRMEVGHVLKNLIFYVNQIAAKLR